jgi:histidine triad (HIT) family protein
MTECLFCKIAAGELPSEIVYQDDEILAFRDINPQAPVHILLIPHEHIPTLLETEPGHTELLGKLQRTAVALARQAGIAEEGFRLVTNCLEGAGQAVFHLHLHLLGGRALGWPPG